jgi:hypothetical protein
MIAALSLIALVAVYLRAEQTRCAAHTLAIESELIKERRELWRVQSAVARLRAPGHIHDRMDWFEDDLVPPGSIESWRSRRRLVSGF